MQSADDPIQLLDLRAVQVDQLMPDSRNFEWSTLSKSLNALAEELEASGDLRRSRAARTLAVCASVWLKPGDRRSPFQVIFSSGRTRTAAIEDIRHVDLQALSEYAPEIANTAFRARVADIVWERKRDHRCALLAVEAYQELALHHEKCDWLDARDYIERASRVAFTLGKSANSQVEQLEQTVIRSIREEAAEATPRLYASHMLALAFEFGFGAPDEFKSIAELLGDKAVSQRGLGLEDGNRYYYLASAFARRAKDVDESKRLALKAARVWLLVADETLQQGRGYLTAVNFLERAYLALREHGADAQEQEKTRDQLLAAQKQAQKELSESRQTIDLTEPIAAFEELLEGQDLFKTLLDYVVHVPALKIDFLRELKDASQDDLFRSLIGMTTVVDRKGRQIARVSGDNQSDLERLILNENATRFRAIVVHAYIDTGRRFVVRNFPVNESELNYLLRHSWFVPSDRLEVFSRGLMAGFSGDFVTACHFLIPQIESSIRYILEMKGLQTTRIDELGVQKEMDLNWLLQLDEVKSIFGPDLHFDLESLLVDKLGANFRNQFAHGLLDDVDFYSDVACYIWWTVLKLCIYPLAIQTQDGPVGEADQDASQA